jgi:L-ornithine N5-monooxygenase
MEMIYDILAVGAGPMNLAIAVAVAEGAGSPQVSKNRVLLVEAKTRFEWHTGMQIPGAEMQTPFLKDLVSQFNPCSEFTFLNYLREKGRLNEFINLRQMYPSRKEFEDYFAWAASKLSPMIQYGQVALSVELTDASENDEPIYIVTTRRLIDGEICKYYARAVSLGIGMTPVLPSSATADMQRLIHSSDFAHRMPAQFPDISEHLSILVVGAGQSGAEIYLHLLRTYPNAKISIASRGFVFRSADANSFVNDLFIDETAVATHDLEDSSREYLRRDLRNSNYAAVDEPLIQTIREELYEQSIHGAVRGEQLSYSSLLQVRSIHGGLAATLKFQLTGVTEERSYDAIICATGFDDSAMRRVIEPFENGAIKNRAGMLTTDVNFRLNHAIQPENNIYLQGYTDALVDSTIICNLGCRAHRVVTDIASRLSSYERNDR